MRFSQGSDFNGPIDVPAGVKVQRGDLGQRMGQGVRPSVLKLSGAQRCVSSWLRSAHCEIQNKLLLLPQPLFSLLHNGEKAEIGTAGGEGPLCPGCSKEEAPENWSLTVPVRPACGTRPAPGQALSAHLPRFRCSRSMKSTLLSPSCVKTLPPERSSPLPVCHPSGGKSGS